MSDLNSKPPIQTGGLHAGLERARQAALAEFRKQPRMRKWQSAFALALIVCLLTAGLGLAATIRSWDRLSGISFILLIAAQASALWMAFSPRIGKWSPWLLTMGIFLGIRQSGGQWLPAVKSLECTRFVLILALLPGLATWTGLRNAYPAPSRLALSALAAGVVGVAVLNMSCPGDSLHVVVFHLVPVLLLVLGTVALRQFIVRYYRARSYAP